MLQADSLKKILLVFPLFLFLFLTSLWITSTSPVTSLKIVSGIIILLISFFSTELALYLLIFSMLLSPEIVIAKTAAREVTIRLEDMLLPIIFFGWLARTAIYKDLGLILKTELNKPILYYILASFISTGFGMIMGRVSISSGFFFVLKYIEFFVVYFMVVNHINTERQVKKYLLMILATAAVIAAYAIVQIPMGVRVSAPFEGGQGEPNTLGGYLVLIISLTTGLIITIRDGRYKILLSILLALLVVPFLYTLSRSSWVAFGAMYLFYLYRSEKRLVFAFFLAVLIPLIPLITPQEIKDRYSETISKNASIPSEQVKIGGYYFDLSTSERINTWGRVLGDWVEKPLFGYGVTGYGFIDGQYFRTLIESGIIGFAALMYLLYSIIRTLYDGLVKTDDPLYKGFYMGLLAGVIALCGHAVGSNTFIIVRIMEPFWFLVGLAIQSKGIMASTKPVA